jgi:hypothetical protein
MGVSWIIAPTSRPAEVPAAFLVDLVKRNIEPVIQVLVEPIRPLKQEPLREAIAKYRDCGVHYLSIYERPNMMARWGLAEWRRPGLLQRFVDMLLPCLEQTTQAGLVPLLPALEPCGDYWDTGFLAGILEKLKGEGRFSLFDRLGLGIYNYAYNRPLSWGKGGRARWKDCLPYHTPPDSEDQRGSYLFEWYDEIVREHIGFSLPMVSLGSGASPGSWEDPTLSSLDEKTAARRNQELARLLIEGEMPDYLFNHAFSLTPEEEAKTTTAKPTLLAKALREVAKHPRLFSWSQGQEVALKGNSPKRIYHYLLFPPAEAGRSVEEWDQARHYIRRFRPTCGFSLEEAMLAEYVTIVGGPLGITSQEERRIRAAGCKVERIGDENGRETKRLLKRMAASGKRFLTF